MEGTSSDQRLSCKKTQSTTRDLFSLWSPKECSKSFFLSCNCNP